MSTSYVVLDVDRLDAVQVVVDGPLEAAFRAGDRYVDAHPGSDFVVCNATGHVPRSAITTRRSAA